MFENKTIMKNTPPDKIRKLLSSKEPKLRVYTFQHIDALKAFENNDIYYPKESVIFKNPEDKMVFSRSYKWMKKQMAERLPDYSGKMPVWVWVEQPGNVSVQRRFGRNQVKITALVDKSRLLLSDFEFWHTVLNDYYMTMSPTEEAKVDSGKFVPTQEDKEKRWEMIFDLTTPSKAVLDHVWGQPYNGRCIQGCLDGLYFSEIENIKVYD